MHYKRTNYFKILGNLRGYLKEYKKVCFSLLCVFVLCAAYILTTHTNAEIREFENYTYVESTSLSTDTMQYDTLARSSTDDAYIINDTDKITSVKISTDKNNEGVGNGTITPDTKYLKITVDFKDIPAESLKKQYNNSFRYNLPDFFRTTSIAKRPIVDENNKTIGTIHVENGQAIVTYTNDFLGELGDNATLSGSFFVEGEVDLTKINKEDGSVQAQVPNGNITLDYGLNYLERYSEVKVEKSYEKDPSSDYIKYQLTVTAGPDGSQNVYVVDKFTTNKNLVTYAGDIPNTPKILGTSENGQQPYETKTTNAPSGKIYLTNQPTSDEEVPDPVTDNTSITQPGSIVWSMEKLNPNEKRTLTYYVLLTDKQNVRKQSITNKASVLNKKDNETYLKGSSEKTFTPLINYQMTKDIISTNGQQYTKDDDGNYIVQYRLNFTLNGNSNYPLKNYAFFDYLNYKDVNYNDRDTDEKMLPYISYVKDSIELHQIKDGNDSTIESPLYKVQWEADGTNYKDTYEGNPKRFKLSGAENNPITINPGDSYYVTYKLKIKPEVYAAMQSEQVTIKNIYANDADNAKKLAGMLDRTRSSQDLVLNEYTWIRKIKDSNLTSENKRIQMNEDVYVKKNNCYEKDSSDKSFVVPEGSYKYTVNLNESQNQFDITHATLKDELSSDIMHYVGYVKITAYEYDKSTDTYKDGESKWVKIDNQKSFELKLSELDWSNNNYGYRFEYYAQTKDLSEVGKINVTNTFTLNGDVKGDKTFKFINKSASQTTQVNGFYNLNVNKGAWYYEKPVEKATTWKNGAFYWVIEVNGSAIRKGTKIKDAVVKENDITDSYLHSNSVVGIYQGNLIKQVGAYKNYQEFLDSNKGLKDKRELFDQEYTNDKNFSGEDNKSELTLTAKQNIKLQNDGNIYIIVKTEPSEIPTANRTTFNYKNEVLLKDTTDKSFIKQNGVTQSLYGGADLLKELNCTFSYDGNQATILNAGTNDKPDVIATDILKTTTGNGLYASWVFKVNYAGDLKGDYRVLEDIPEGMELGYIRIKWHGKEAGSVGSKTMNDLGNDWTNYSNTATNDNGGNQSTTYYYNKTTNKALIKLGEFVNGHIRDECSIDVQVVCRVTDPKVLLGGESKEFMNVVTLQDEKGKDLATSSCPATLQNNSLDKNHLERYNGNTIQYRITANPLAQKLPSNDGNDLTLVDVLGKTLELDKTSIKAEDDVGHAVEIKKVFDPATNTLEISIPNGKKIIITYTVTVNIRPDTPSEVSNKVYWKSYESQGGKNDIIQNFTYNLNAGGSTTTTENPKLSINKCDQDDNMKPLKGVTFDIYECELNGDQIKRVEGSTTSGKTDENGVLTVKSPFVTSYNTIYEVKEKNALDGYMKDDNSYYIICVDRGNSDDYTYYVKQCIEYFENQSNNRYKVAYFSTNFKLTIYNSQKGIVVKKAFINDAAGTSHKPVSGTYKFGLYDNSEGTGSPKQVNTITYSTGDTEEKTTKFINLDPEIPYYVFELDDKDCPITNTSQEVTVNKLPYVVDYKVKEVSTSKAVVGDQVKVTNSLRTKKLPSSGSRLTQIFRQLGLVMVGTSFIVLLIVYKNRDKKIKEEEIGK